MKLKQDIDYKGIHSDVKNISFERLSWKLCMSNEADMSKDECALAEREYRRFLTLKKLYPKNELVPNKLLDKFWHAHILDGQFRITKIVNFYLENIYIIFLILVFTVMMICKT